MPGDRQLVGNVISEPTTGPAGPTEGAGPSQARRSGRWQLWRARSRIRPPHRPTP